MALPMAAFRDTADQGLAKTRATVGADHDQVRTFLLGSLDGHFVGLARQRHSLDLKSVAHELSRGARHRLAPFLLPLFAVTGEPRCNHRAALQWAILASIANEAKRHVESRRRSPFIDSSGTRPPLRRCCCRR